MFRVVGSITQNHDLGLLALAGLICALAAHTSIRLLRPAGDNALLRSTIRDWAAVVAFATGVWTTHFTAMLAFHPDMPVSFDIPLCILSLALAIIGTAVAFTIRPRHRGASPLMIVASGLVLAAGIGAMHFVGMASMRVSAILQFDPGLVVASLLLGAICGVAGMWLLAAQAQVWAAVSLTFSVLFTHFVAMGSITLCQADGLVVPPLGLPKSELVMATTGACLLLLALALIASILDGHFTRRLALQAQRYRTLADATFEGLIFERAGQIMDANRAMYELAERDAATLIGRPLSDLFPGIEILQVERGRPLEHAMRLPRGDTIPVEMLWRTGSDHGESVVAIRDISREKAAEWHIERMMRSDPLTGLVNSAVLEEELHRAMALSDRTGTGVAVLYIDLDGFQTVIEAKGHTAAEQILIQTARRLTAAVENTDTVARVGRDAFVIIRGLTKQSAATEALADTLLAETKIPVSVADQQISVTASIGIALYPNDGPAAPDLIMHAALAMRQSKNDGRARWSYFEPSMDILLRTRQTLEKELQRALKENEFCLNYQPFVDTVTLEVIGYEALLRWDHPEGSRVPPGDFIPFAEESGLIVPIGSWVLATACAEAASWNQPLIISVNLSPAQFVQPGIVSTVAEVLRHTGLPPNRLELEITEGTLMEDSKNALTILTSLKALGVKIAMDDFGTGYSSLSYLRKFPFDKIKIDRSFISDVEEASEAQTIVEAIIAMSRSLKLHVTAEGVETKQQLSMLRSLGCNFVQGYLLGRPRSATQLRLREGGQRWHLVDRRAPRLVAGAEARTA
jgi:diguanylate cyclase (GGDEF)-like protein